jgi:DNA-directed RNA polymerase subunit RPC12/RpoP
MSFDGMNCPNCGAELPGSVLRAKMVACDYCESTVLLEDDALRTAGTKGVMAQEPSLFALGRELRYRRETFLPVGQARFSYGAGWWDEFWAVDGGGEGVWVSVDEGEIAVERPYDAGAALSALSPERLAMGAKVQINGERFTVTEADHATCIALRGEFPEALHVGQTYHYWHLSGAQGRLVTLEYSDGEFAASEGTWVDPYLIRSENAEA